MASSGTKLSIVSRYPLISVNLTSKHERGHQDTKGVSKSQGDEQVNTDLSDCDSLRYIATTKSTKTKDVDPTTLSDEALMFDQLAGEAGDSNSVG